MLIALNFLSLPEPPKIGEDIFLVRVRFFFSRFGTETNFFSRFGTERVELGLASLVEPRKKKY